ncbi:MAG: excinuclease ABC subunit C [Candidatus Cloacimonas sp. 4484_275]|nr:MAG: excinuclease ABC subunit C [Candidatus Cloacimonas sp. 4484_275]
MAEISQKIKDKLALLPEKPGVYLMKNSSGKIIYVGKSKNLKHRVRSYFSGTPSDNKTMELVAHINDFDYIITTTEVEALLLEANLIKKHKPKYNIFLIDDKQYPFIKISLKEPFPKIEVTRDKKRDGAAYFGPFTDVKAIRKTMRMLEWIFPHRTCNRKIPSGKPVFKRACMNYQMGKCPAPCIGKISEEDYRRIIFNVIRFLKGKNKEVLAQLQEEMKQKSAKLQFEEAAKIRDRINDIRKITFSQNMYFTDDKNRDVIGIYQEGKKAAVAILKILSGRLLNKEIYALDNAEGKSVAELTEAFLKQYYSGKSSTLPYRIFLSEIPSDFPTLNLWLKNKIVVPQRGEMKKLTKMARENAFNFIEEQKLKHLRKSNRTIFPIKELKDKLGLRKLPRKIICLDISTIQGSDTVSSLVFFENGKPKKKNYRRFIIKTVSGQNDFASLAETLTRYLKKIEEPEKPDLIVIDGGKGQLSSAFEILKKSGIEDIEMISLAKRLEEIFLPNKSNSVVLPHSSPSLRLLIKLRDEAHRFAITFHRKRRSARTLTSELDKIKGVGTETKFRLLKEFGSVKNIKKAEINDLMSVKGIGRKLAEKILSELSC